MSDKPPKKKVANKRARSATPKEQFDAPALDKAEQKEITSLINAALADNSEEAKLMMSAAQQRDAIVGMLGEFMRNFTLIGFNLNDQPVILSKATTAIDSEALTSLTRKVYASHLKAYG